MARMKRGEPGSEEASARWRATMIKKYGSEDALRQALAERGKKGGRAGHTGGFCNNPLLARVAGRKGGMSSRRGPVVQEILDPRQEEVDKMLSEGYPVSKISKHFGVSPGALNRWRQRTGRL